MGQKLVVRVEDSETKEIDIRKGVRQGCCTFPVPLYTCVEN